MATPKTPADERGIPGVRVYDTFDPIKRTGESRVEFDHWSAFTEYCERRPVPDGFRITENASRKWSGGTSWDLGAGWDGAAKLARDGWPEGRDKMAKIANSHFDVLSKTIEQPEVQYDVTGNMFDIGRVLEGCPESWVTFENELRDGAGRRIIELVVSTCASGGVDASILFARGAVMGALVELLEFAGHSVGVTIDWSSGGWESYGRRESGNEPGAQFVSRVRVKEAGQPLDMNRMAYAVAHPACLRRHGFAVTETTQASKLFGGGYGSVRDANADERGDLYSGPAHLNADWVRSEDAAKQFLREQLRAQGVNIE